MRAFKTKGDVAALVACTIGKYLDVRPGQVVPETHLARDLGIDSLEAVELLQELEDEFETVFSNAERDSMECISDIIEILWVKAQRRP
jgi:acyl carrier protein